MKITAIPRTLSLVKRKISPETRHAIKYTLLLLIITRIVLTGVGLLSRAINGGYPLYSDYLWLDIWGAWDTSWYLNIANDGYSATPNPESLGNPGQANYAFFPLYPFLMRGMGVFVGDTFLAGIIISNLSLIVASVFLYKLVRLEHDKRTALRSVKYLFLFPTAFLLSAVFSEALFLALLIMCFYYAKKGDWLLVGISGFFLSLTRGLGVIVLLPLLYEYLRQKKFVLRKIEKDAVFLALIPLGASIFALYNLFLVGDPLAFINIQSTWHHSLSNPLDVLYSSLFSTHPYSIFSALFTLTFLALLVAFYRKLEFSHWLLGMFLIIIPLSSSGQPFWIVGMARYLLVIFPFFILFARLGEKSRVDLPLIVSLALLQVFLMFVWTMRGYWLI